jgi:hypothetical protein
VTDYIIKIVVSRPSTLILSRNFITLGCAGDQPEPERLGQQSAVTLDRRGRAPQARPGNPGTIFSFIFFVFLQRDVTSRGRFGRRLFR